MYTGGMNFDTDAGIFWTRPHEDPDRILLCSLDAEPLLEVLKSIELAGVAEGLDFDDLYIIRPDETTEEYELDVDRVTLILWFQFEVLNYLHVGGEYNA